MFVPYNYEMVSNNTQMVYDTLSLSDVVLDVEYAITDFLLKSLFAECAAYYEATRGRLLRQLATTDQVIGISAQPDDVVTDGT
jgi:hypothetical protein